MSSPESPVQPPTPENAAEASGGLPPEPDSSMQEYYQLQQDLLKGTLILTGIIFGSVWVFYSLNIALNYLIGACVGVVYLRMLARNVAQLGREKQSLGSTRLALLVGVIVVASRLEDLQIMPIFLGFLTYKAAVIFYMLKTTILPDS
ncbi:ATP synthase subunit I [Leptolyngbya sp. GB1-A1]|uniref:ATP synthase subunit I n=1 Tax=unclassified Leptolyngbya TaxID=2650499 RepID=UPI00329A5E32